MKVRFAFAMSVALVSTSAMARTSDAQIKQQVIRESIERYPGSCPCPYSTDRAGRRCGNRSAYDRPGGYALKCFDGDVSVDEVREYRARHKE